MTTNLKALDERIAQIKNRFEASNLRFRGQSSDALVEEWRQQFRNLSDLMIAQAEKEDAWFDRLQAEIRAGMTEIEKLIQALVADRAGRPRRKRVN